MQEIWIRSSQAEKGTGHARNAAVWRHLLAVLLRAAVCAAILFPAFRTAYAAPGYDQVAAFSDTASAKEVGKYGMTPVYGQDIADGTYVVKTECSSPFFRILEAKLTVENGEMTAVLTMSSKSYLFVYMGTAEDAAKAELEEYIPLEEAENRRTFTVPVRALNTPVDCAAFSRNREKWYGRKILFDAGSLPREAVAFPVPDYGRIESAIRLYDMEKGTDTKAELYGVEAQETENMADLSGNGPEPVAMEEPDGEYSIEVDMTGGSGRASVTTPTWLYVRDGKGYAKLLWSSVYYDYMIVGGEMFLNETTDGSNSTFTIPIMALDEPVTVIADTTAMGDPVEIEYTLTFYGDTVDGKGRVPQEAARTVIYIAVFIIIAGGIANHFVKKRRR